MMIIHKTQIWMIQWMLLQWMLQRITNLVHQEVTSDVDLIMMQTALKVNAAVLTDGVDPRKLTVTVINAIDSQMQFLKTISNLVHQEVTSDVDLNSMPTVLKVPAAVPMDGVDLQKLTVIVMNATDLQKSQSKDNP